MMTELVDLEPAAEILHLVNALPDELERYYWLTQLSRSSILALPEYKGTIQTALREMTGKALSSDKNFLTWAAVVTVADNVGLDDEAIAFRQVLDVARAEIEASLAKLETAAGIALRLGDFETFRALISLTPEPAGLTRASNLRSWWQSDPSVAGLPEYKQAVIWGLRAATNRLLSSEKESNWGQLVQLANDVGLVDEAQGAFEQGLEFLRSNFLSKGRTKEGTAQEVIALALGVKDYVVVRECLIRGGQTVRRRIVCKDWTAERDAQ